MLNLTEIKNFVSQKLVSSEFDFEEKSEDNWYTFYIPSIEMSYKIRW